MAGIRQFVQKIISHLIYPVKKGDWYKAKGYEGKHGRDSFQEFVYSQQQDEDAVFTDFQYLDAKREMVEAELTHHHKAKLETVTLTPKANLDIQGKSGRGKHIIYFFGRNEPLEVKYRELTKDAVELGCTVHAFNLPGMHNSTGRMIEYNDALNCGMTLINKLLREGVAPDEILLKGNCFGASIASDVAHQCSIQQMQVRCINSNSYKSLRDVIIEAIPIMRDLVRSIVSYFSILNYTGWYSDVAEKNLITTPYHCTIHREGDKTIAENAKLCNALQQNIEEINPAELIVPGFEESQKFLDKHNKMTVKPNIHKDPHIVAFGDLEWHDGESKKEAWKFVDEFLKRSNQYVEAHPQPAHHEPLQMLTHRAFEHVSIENLQQLHKSAEFQQGIKKVASEAAGDAFRLALSAKKHTPPTIAIKVENSELNQAAYSRVEKPQIKEK